MYLEYSIPNSDYLQILSVAREQDFFVDPKGGDGIAKVR